jgi:colanic acid biosynthesis glycosyl transferase WcaI
VEIVIHSQYYYPELGAPQARLTDLAQGLARRGHEVTVITAMPNYPQGRIYPGYGGMIRGNQSNGVDIVRTFIYATQKTDYLPRLTNYFSFVFSSCILGGILINEPDYILTESPPLFLGISGYALSRWKRAKWIFNVSDLWPESAVRLGIIHDGLALKLSQALEKFCYQQAWIISGQSRSILKNIHERYPEVRTFHFSNGVDTSLFNKGARSTEWRNHLGHGSEIVALYAGLHGLAQGLDQILLTAKNLQSATDLIIAFLGDGPEKHSLMAKAKNLGLTNVRFLDPVPREEMPSIIAAADICLVPLRYHIPGAVPSKLYEAMAGSKPVVLVANGEAAQIVNEYNAGIVVEPGDVHGIARAIKTLAENPSMRKSMGESGRKAAIEHYDRGNIVEKFAEFLENSI